MYFCLPSFKEDQRVFKFNYPAAFKNRHVLSVFIYIFCISLFYHGIQQWLGVYFSTQFNFSQFLISMLVTLTSLSGIFGEVLGGHLADTRGRVRTIDMGIILMIFSVLALIFKAPPVVLALLMIIWGLGWTFNHAGLSTMLTDLPKEFLNEAASLNSSVRFISGGLGALLGGILIQKGFVFSFLTFGVSLLVLLVFARNLLTTKQGG
jgi:predicted MFS family arabinose efflux permease